GPNIKPAKTIAIAIIPESSRSPPYICATTKTGGARAQVTRSWVRPEGILLGRVPNKQRYTSDLFRISTCFSQCLRQSAQGLVGGLGYFTLGLVVFVRLLAAFCPVRTSSSSRIVRAIRLRFRSTST